MTKRTLAQAARNIVTRQNVRITTQEFQAFKKERGQANTQSNVTTPTSNSEKK